MNEVSLKQCSEVGRGGKEGVLQKEWDLLQRCGSSGLGLFLLKLAAPSEIQIVITRLNITSDELILKQVKFYTLYHSNVSL